MFIMKIISTSNAIIDELEWGEKNIITASSNFINMQDDVQ